MNTLKEWLKQPFSADQSALSWVMFLGLIVIAAFAWQLVLLKIIEESPVEV